MTISDVAAPAAPVSDVAATGGAAAPTEHLTPPSRHYAMTAPTFFAVEYAINPWMDTSTPVDTHVAMNQWETLRQTYQGTRPHRRVGRARRRPARHGLRRQRRSDRQRQGHRRPVRLPAARRRVRRLRRVDGPPRLRPRRDPARQRGPGRSAGRRLNRVGRIRFPHRPSGPRRDRRSGGHAGGQPRAGRPALLSPRHRAGGARRHHDRVLPTGVQRRGTRPTARAVPGCHRGRQRRRVRARPQRRVRRHSMSSCLPPQQVSPSNCAMPVSSPSASISPSCSRAADPSNAARWRYIRDHP